VDGEKNLPPLSLRGRGLIPTRGCGPSLSSLALSRSLSVSLSQVHAEHEVGVALDGVAEGWVAVERKVALPPPPRRAVRRIRLLHQVSSSGARDPAPPSGPHSSTASSCSCKLPPARGVALSLSLSHHSSPSSSTAQGAACHDTLTTAISSGGGARRSQAAAAAAPV
jgi:hypothetical protein